MEGYVEEDEIKIEYYADYETDPLSEKPGNKLILSSDVQDKECEEFTARNFVQYDNTIDNHVSSPSLADTISVTVQEEFDDCYVNTTTTNHINWYREIDDSGKFVCQFCDLTYSTIQTTRHHVKTKHPEKASALKDIIKNNKRNPKIKCHICKERFKDVNVLKDHVNKYHPKDIQKFCHICFVAFNNDQEMTEHLHQIHQNVRNTKTHMCTLCGYQTRKLSHFKQHTNTHIANKQMKCELCDYATNYSPNLRIHQRIHTNYKPYSCTFHNCCYRCSAKSALRSHLLKHNPEENLLYCDKCTYKTVYKSSLKKHIESHNRNTLK